VLLKRRVGVGGVAPEIGQVGRKYCPVDKGEEPNQDLTPAMEWRGRRQSALSRGLRGGERRFGKPGSEKDEENRLLVLKLTEVDVRCGNWG